MSVAQIRQVATAAASDACFLTAEFESRVSMWSLTDRTLLAAFDTILDFGGRRLALCGTDWPIVVACAWQGGVRGYEGDGTQLWQRPEVRQPQRITPLAGGALVAVCAEDGPMQVLDASSGQTVGRVRRLEGFYPSPFADVGIGSAVGHAVLVLTDDWREGWKIPIRAKMLSGAACPGAFTIADNAGSNIGEQSSVSCLDLAGDILWEWFAPPDVNCNRLAWDTERSEWVGLLHPIHKPQPQTLMRWSAVGNVLMHEPIGRFHAYAFLPRGKYLVTNDGAVRDTRTTEIVWSLPTASDPS